MTPTTVALGPVDAVTPEARLSATAALGVRVREVLNLVPDPARPSGQPATGYAVPAPAVAVETVAGLVAAFDAPGPDGTTVRHLVTGAEGTQVQGARLGQGALYLATETPDGAATPVRRVSAAETAVLQPSVPVNTVGVSIGYATDPAQGLLPGRYGYRLAYAYDDGSLGPATAPREAYVSPVPAGLWPFTVYGSNAEGNGAVLLDGSAAAAAFRAFSAEGDSGGVVMFIEGDRYTATASADLTVPTTLTSLTVTPALRRDYADGARVRFGERTAVTFTLALATVLPPSATAVRLLLTAPGPSRVNETTVRADDLVAAPYFDLGPVGLGAGAAFVFEGTEAKILGRPLYAEGHVGQHTLLARRVATTGGRLVFGGVALDLATPAVPLAATSGDARDVLVRVTVETEAGPRVRWALATAPGATGSLARPATGSVWYYPDARASAFDFYARDAGTSDPFVHTARLPLSPALTQNAAYAAAVDVDVSTSDGGAPAPDAATRTAQNAILDDNPGRVLLTGAGRPYEWLAERLSSPGPAGQSCMGFAAFGGALSQGQFGEYPLVAFYERSVFAGAFSDTGELTRWRPLEQERGAVSPQAFAAHGSAIYYLAADGLYALTADGGRSARLSAPVQRLSGARALGGVLLPGPQSCVGVYDDGVRLEVWVGSASDDVPCVWVYSVAASTADTPRWGRLARSRTFFQPASAPDVGLYGIGPGSADSGTLYAETDTEAVRGDAFSLATAGLTPAGGTSVVLFRLGLVADLACRARLGLYEDAEAQAAPGTRRETTDALGGHAPSYETLLDADVRRETPVRYRMLRTSVRIDTGTAATGVAGTDALPRVGDRLVGLTYSTTGAVRARRTRILAT